MVHPWQPGKPLPDKCSAVLFGPGLAAGDLPSDLKSELRQFWQELPLPVVVDASALDWLPASSKRLGALRLITPHPGEAARMLQTTVAAVQKDRPAAVRALSKRFGGCWVALKGHQTIMGRSGGDLFVNSSGNPFLAQGAVAISWPVTWGDCWRSRHCKRTPASHPLRGVAAWRGGGQAGGGATKLDDGRPGGGLGRSQAAMIH